MLVVARNGFAEVVVSSKMYHLALLLDCDDCPKAGILTSAAFEVSADSMACGPLALLIKY